MSDGLRRSAYLPVWAVVVVQMSVMSCAESLGSSLHTRFCVDGKERLDWGSFGDCDVSRR